MQFAFRLVILLDSAGSCLECWLDLFQFVRLLGRLPDFPGWRFESLLVSAENYCWRNLLQFAFRLVILLELAERCLESWQNWLQLVNQFG